MTGLPRASYTGVSKRYGERRALVDFTLAVQAGEVVGLLGANGAGKTTALRLLCGLLAPDEGRVEIAGHDVWTDPISARKNLGYVPDGAPLYSSLTPFEHLRLVGSLHGLDAERIEAEADRLLGALELQPRGRDPVGALSRGMRQKVAIACALLHRPPLLVLDEPLTGLDSPTGEVVKAVMRAWADRGGGVLVTSHLLESMERVCDRIAILDAGRLMTSGSFDDLRAKAGQGTNLEEVFRVLTRSQDPAEAAARILGV